MSTTYVVVIRQPNAPGVNEPTQGFKLWSEVFANIFSGPSLDPTVVECIERTDTGSEVYSKAQMQAVGARVDEWDDVDQDWRSALP